MSPRRCSRRRCAASRCRGPSVRELRRRASRRKEHRTGPSAAVGAARVLSALRHLARVGRHPADVPELNRRVPPLVRRYRARRADRGHRDGRGSRAGQEGRLDPRARDLVVARGSEGEAGDVRHDALSAQAGVPPPVRFTSCRPGRRRTAGTNAEAVLDPRARDRGPPAGPSAGARGSVPSPASRWPVASTSAA